MFNKIFNTLRDRLTPASPSYNVCVWGHIMGRDKQWVSHDIIAMVDIASPYLPSVGDEMFVCCDNLGSYYQDRLEGVSGMFVRVTKVRHNTGSVSVDVISTDSWVFTDDFNIRLTAAGTDEFNQWAKAYLQSYDRKQYPHPYNDAIEQDMANV